MLYRNNFIKIHQQPNRGHLNITSSLTEEGDESNADYRGRRAGQIFDFFFQRGLLMEGRGK